ncbi:MAG TPA: hypothetical protein VN017_05395 [Pseudoxanthomonas sp.]|nr:hypothetical protein [Pseudoxanthomonas sp.]
MDVYEKHSATFRNVSAYVITRGAQRVATVAFKSGTTEQAFVHWIGSAMIRATANGGGYDRQSAACAKAASKATHNGDALASAFWTSLAIDGGRHWYQELERAGFTVLQAV